MAAAPATDATLPPDGQYVRIEAPMYIADEELAPPPPSPPRKRKKATKAAIMERRRQEEIEFKQLEKRVSLTCTS